MKKIISLSIGILVFAILLINWGCGNSKKIQDNKKVTIHLQAVIKSGKKHLKLSDSDGNKATDHLVTLVNKGDTIIWRLKTFSKIDKIERIYSSDPLKVIFKNDAQETSKNVFMLIVPDDVSVDMMEKYKIEFRDKDSTTTIDPYIRID